MFFVVLCSGNLKVLNAFKLSEKIARLKRELDAQQVSDSIDEDIKQERAMKRKNLFFSLVKQKAVSIH